MTLSFKEVLKNKFTFFPHKIIRGLRNHKLITIDEYDYYEHLIFLYSKIYSEALIAEETFGEAIKIHTIREDKNNRWKAGNKINFVINNYTPDRLQFAVVIPVTTVQKIEIFNKQGEQKVIIDGRQLSGYETLQLSANDGFDSVEDFFTYFNQPHFTGKLIHWTKTKY